MSTPSVSSQEAVDAQLFDDQARVSWSQIRAHKAQLIATRERMSEILRIDIQRIDAHHRAQMRRVAREIQEMDEDMRNINWDIGQRGER